MRGIGFLVAGVYVVGAAALEQPSPPHAPDGRVVERVQSISIPPTPNAPFSATLVAELVKLLPDGSTSTLKNHRTIMRDSAGRIFQERRFFKPDGDREITRLQVLEYEDPARHERYSCSPEQKVCSVYRYFEASVTRVALPSKNVTVEDLGRETIQNVEAVGSREITTIPQGAIGNKNPEPIVKEFWYSPGLNLNLIVKRFDPRSGMQNFRVTNLNLAEPNAALLQPPADYRMFKATPEISR